MSGERSLKSQNMKWLVALALADALVLLLLATPGPMTAATLSQLGIGRALTTTLIPVLVLLVVNVLPHDVKSMLVYWKPRGVLPGCEAFTKHGPDDQRVDMATLKKRVGELPSDPREQNARWYALFKMVANETEVSEAHKMFLLYRDMAVLSLALILIGPLLLYAAYASAGAQWAAGTIFGVQYLLTAISARWSGIRFVCNVLAVHSASVGKPRRPSCSPAEH
jgi:hypothetical protein